MKNFKKAGEVLSDIWSSTEINGYKVSAKWVDPKDSAKSFGNFTDRKVGSDWLNQHVRISKYCLEIAKCDDSTCCKALRTNVQTILKEQFLPTPPAMGSDVTLADPLLKSEKTKFLSFFESSALQHLRPTSYRSCTSLPYDLYCPSVSIDDKDYVCPFSKCRKINTTKDLLSLHLKATQHHACIDEEEWLLTEEPIEEVPITNVLDLPDGPCLIKDFKSFIGNTWEITYD